MTSDDLRDVGKELASTTREYVAGAVGEFLGRLKALEDRIASVRDGARGDKGDRGEPGAPGRDGVDADPTVLVALKTELETLRTELATVRESQKSDSVTNELRSVVHETVKGEFTAVTSLITAEVHKAIEAQPKAKDGLDGKDGIGLAGMLIDRDGDLVATLSNGVTKALGPVVGAAGKDGRDGVNGQDGINLDFFTVEMTRNFDPETRMITDRYVSGERVKEVTWKHVGAPVYRGVYKAGQSYEAGDIVTYGHVWIAKELTTAKPDEHTSDGKRAWQMLMRRGADGKQGPAGPAGKDGRDGLDGKDRWQP